ncbi:hypothetical protein SeMB42_g04610 [Synchytrium endobioticum]|uniref:DUF300-domain-containing protein n=1 Tax=Synchytrium endobioticum TaxID=286115 RepID=A0A507CXH7_9FUNG|nr:hypothetical protein SeMB42_g04610 [Synchytrium endobioticum]
MDEAYLAEDCAALKGASFDPASPDYNLVMHMWIVTIVFSILASLLSFYLCYRHFQHYFKPNYQRHIVRILLMVPIYALCSTLSFRFYKNSIYFDIVRDGYEAFVIYSFFHLLMDYLGPDFESRHARLMKKSTRTCLFPFICFKYSPRGHAFLINCRVLVLQYVIVRPLMTILALVLQTFEVLCPNSSSPAHGAFWISGTNLISVSIAMYGLLEFYIVIHHDIAEHNPFYKILAVKLVVFFSFWQSIVLSILEALGLLSADNWSADSLSDLIQSFLVCLEMLIAAFLHIYAFSHREFVPSPPMKTPIWVGFKDAVWPSDIMSDIKAAPLDVRKQARRRKDKKARRKMEAVNGDDFADGVSLNDVDLEGMGSSFYELHSSSSSEGESDEEAGGKRVNYAVNAKPFSRATSPVKVQAPDTPITEAVVPTVSEAVLKPLVPKDINTFLEVDGQDDDDDGQDDDDVQWDKDDHRRIA